MHTPSISDEAVKAATGRSWDAWFELMHQAGAAELSHPEIAARLADEYGVAPWWTQSITVEFERAIGRRQVGQSTSGDYAASASKTLRGDMDAALRAWQEHVRALPTFDGVPLASEPDVSHTENWRYWRVSLADGSKVVVNFSNKVDGKALLQVNHEKLPDQDAVERWKAYWKGILKRMSAKQVPR